MLKKKLIKNSCFSQFEFATTFSEIHIRETFDGRSYYYSCKDPFCFCNANWYLNKYTSPLSKSVLDYDKSVNSQRKALPIAECPVSG